MKECLPYTSFNDFMKDANVSNILMRPVHNFFNMADDIVKPLKDTLSGLRRQLLLEFQENIQQEMSTEESSHFVISQLNFQEELFGDSLEDIWKENNLQYIGMLFTVPRMICLLILIFGMLMAWIHTCQMRIFMVN